ncbi:hypothetical protein [Flavobacterium sp.]|uniref:hypothetical protein n=1 Tax=Flavobacterium sp. TaxID=239 RepID=UPI00374FF1D1
MKTSKVALLLYILFCVLAIIANICGSESLKLVTKPFIVPALVFYYLIKTKKINSWVCLFLMFSFIGDAVGLMNFDNEIVYIVFPFFLAIICMIILIIKNLEKFKYNKFNCFSLLLISSLVGYVWHTSVELFSFSEGIAQTLVFCFGFSVFIMTSLVSYNIIWKTNIPNLFLMLSATCVIVSDFFYLIYNFQNQLVIIDYIHFSCQVFSYYFFIKYILLKENDVLLKKINNVT